MRPLCVGALVAGALACLAACKPASPPAAAEAAQAWKLDEGKLIQPIRFSAAELDTTKQACADFTGFVNDKWLAANPIPADQASWGPWEILDERSWQVQRQLAEQATARNPTRGIEKVIADIWSTGMDQARRNEYGAAPLISRLEEILALRDSAGIAAYVRTSAARGTNPLFEFYSEADFRDSSTKIAYAMQGGISLPDRNYYFDADKKPIREAFLKHIEKVLTLSGFTPAKAAVEAPRVMAFETRLARVSKSSVELARDLSLYYNPVTIEEASRLTPNFSWSTFFLAQQVAAPAKFSLAVPAFHREVDRMLTEVSVSDWQSYLRFRLVDFASNYLDDALAAERFDFYNRTLWGQQELRPLWKRVIAQQDAGVGEAMGQLYVQVAFPAESRERMQRLVDNLLAALKVRLEKLSWMSDATRQRALAKWSAFGSKIGHSSKWRDWSSLATSRESYYANMMAARAFNHHYDLNKIGKPTDRSEWQMTPQTVNAYNNWMQNEIVFPAAVLQPPFFDPQADDALNYGAIGSVIGHELIHGYDDQGSRFGPTGNMEDWWAPQDKGRFATLTRKLVAQYDRYEALPGIKVSGKLTLGENIADLGGLNVAFDALQRATQGQPDPKTDGFTREQRFFMGFATVWRAQLRPEALKTLVSSDTHAPDAVRARGTLQNMPTFAAAFGCKAGDGMVNSGERLLRIW